MRYSGFIIWPLVCVFLWMGSSSGVALVQGSGKTGAPRPTGGNEASCSQCHFGGNFGTGIDILVKDVLTGTSVTAYSPGETYDVQIVVTTSQGMPSAYGFQFVAIRDSDLSNAGLLGNAGNDVRFTTLSDVGRTYAEHDKPHTSDNTFEFRWTAPAAGSGTVTFYVSANAVNLDFFPDGDHPEKTSFKIQENTATSIEHPTSFAFDPQLYPNPVANTVHIVTDVPGRKHVVVEIFDVRGRNMLTTEVPSAAILQIPVSAWPNGSYIARISSAESAVIRKFTKQ